MYSSEYLSRYPFFSELLQSSSPEEIHDSLTGTLARPCLFRFVRSLIEAKQSFMMAIVDLDNFKSINDNYGHRTGDEMLAEIGVSLCRYVGEMGVVGRYGGDEFLIIYFGDTDYDAIHAFLGGMFRNEQVFRRNLLVRGRTIFSTATIGSAVCPRNAESFESLFALVDKALYRGKSKGRNCFIIYVPEKHAHLEIPTLARRSLYDAFCHMAEAFDEEASTASRLGRAFAALKEFLNLHRLLFLSADNQLFDAEDGSLLCAAEPPASLISGGLYTARSLHELERVCPSIAKTLSQLDFESVLISEVRTREQFYGYLLFCPEIHTLHIWQENECVAAFFLSRMLAQRLERQGEQKLW